MKRYYVDMRYAEEVDDTQLSPTQYERIMVPADEAGAEIGRLKDIIMAGARGAGFDEVEMALAEAEKDVDLLTEEIARLRRVIDDTEYRLGELGYERETAIRTSLRAALADTEEDT